MVFPFFKTSCRKKNKNERICAKSFWNLRSYIVGESLVQSATTMSRIFLKFTYHLEDKNMNAYIKMPSTNYLVLKKDIETCLFQGRQQSRCKIRIYWIDEDDDEIEVLNQYDYDIFLAKSNHRQHLHVEPIRTNVEHSERAADAYELDVHSDAQCSGCGMFPITGFRYKCIQCQDYDLCERCESNHDHPEHLMLRMPTNESYQIISNLEKDYIIANKSAISSPPNSWLTVHQSSDEKIIDQMPTQEKPSENAPTNNEIENAGSESEKESVSDSFVELSLDEKSNEIIYSVKSSNNLKLQTQPTILPPKSLHKPNVLDSSRISTDLKADIAQNCEKDTLESNEDTKEMVEKAVAAVSEPETITYPTSSPTSHEPEEKPANPVYHSDQRINNAVVAMMSMGFSNKGHWLTQLMESVDGNIPEALDAISAAKSGDRH